MYNDVDYSAVSKRKIVSTFLVWQKNLYRVGTLYRLYGINSHGSYLIENQAIIQHILYDSYFVFSHVLDFITFMSSDLSQKLSFKK